jgi:hypothetical protein
MDINIFNYIKFDNKICRRILEIRNGDLISACCIMTIRLSIFRRSLKLIKWKVLRCIFCNKLCWWLIICALYWRLAHSTEWIELKFRFLISLRALSIFLWNAFKREIIFKTAITLPMLWIFTSWNLAKLSINLLCTIEAICLLC